MIAPGRTIGIVGGGQLGRMLSIAAAQLGYRCHIYAPEPSGPAADVAARWVQGRYEDADALAAFAQEVDLVTYEFENIPVASLAAIEGLRPVHPPLRALETAQDRAAEKSFAGALGVPVAPWRTVDDEAGLAAAIAEIGLPAVLKTRRFGYDGKGQARLHAPEDAGAAWAAIGGRPAILERIVAFEAEFSILAARDTAGGWIAWPAVTNVHRDGILRTSTLPSAGIVTEQAEAATAIVRRMMDALDYVGVLAVEFFAYACGPLFNEMAPRVHNSGHWSIEGAETSQFENHVRAITGIGLGATALAGAGVTMHNLIGADVERWRAWLADGWHLHLYGKGSPRPGRKMGHVTRVERAR